MFGGNSGDRVELDTECFMLLGLLFCRDRQNQKASIFYSLLQGGNSGQRNGQNSAAAAIRQNSDELHCMDEAIENAVFKLCIISNMFIEYHALPIRAGKTELKML